MKAYNHFHYVVESGRTVENYDFLDSKFIDKYLTDSTEKSLKSFERSKKRRKNDSD